MDQNLIWEAKNFDNWDSRRLLKVLFVSIIGSSTAGASSGPSFGFSHFRAAEADFNLCLSILAFGNDFRELYYL